MFDFPEYGVDLGPPQKNFDAKMTVVFSPPVLTKCSQSVGLCEPHEVQQGQVQGPAPWSG